MFVIPAIGYSDDAVLIFSPVLVTKHTVETHHVILHKLYYGTQENCLPNKNTNSKNKIIQLKTKPCKFCSYKYNTEKHWNVKLYNTLVDEM